MATNSRTDLSELPAVVLDVAECCLVIDAAEQGDASEEEVCDHTHWPQVRREADSLTLGNLGRHKLWHTCNIFTESDSTTLVAFEG